MVLGVNSIILESGRLFLSSSSENFYTKFKIITISGEIVFLIFEKKDTQKNVIQLRSLR